MYSLLLVVIGIVDLYYSWRFITDAKFRMNYVQHSPKALVWRKLFGETKAIALMKSLFAPVGLALGIYLILIGTVSFGK